MASLISNIPHQSGAMFSIKRKVIMVNTCDYIFIQTTECTPPRGTPEADHALRAIAMCQRRSIGHCGCPTPVGDVSNGGGCVWEVSVPSS